MTGGRGRPPLRRIKEVGAFKTPSVVRLRRNPPPSEREAGETPPADGYTSSVAYGDTFSLAAKRPPFCHLR